MKKVIFTSLLLIAPFCRAADPADMQEYFAKVDPKVWEDLGHSTKQYFVDLGGNIKLYSMGCVVNMSSDLRGINFSNSHLTALPYNMRNGLIEELNLNNNQFTTIPHTLGSQLDGLLELELNDNHIEAIPYNLKLIYLQILKLKNNDIQTINPDVLAQFPNLRELHLDQNRLLEDNINELKVKCTPLSRPKSSQS